MLQPLIDAARIQNLLIEKMPQLERPLSIRELLDCPQFAGASYLQMRDSLKQLHKHGKVRRVPSTSKYLRDRAAFEWIVDKSMVTDFLRGTSAPIQPKFTAAPISPVQDLRIKVNEDASITIITSHIRITIEVPK